MKYLDVRTKEEWLEDHLEDAVHVAVSDLNTETLSVFDKDEEITVFCAAGGRAARAKAVMEELGFKNVTNGGGISDIKNK